MYWIEYDAFDANYDDLHWQLETNASWLSFDTDTQLLLGTPTNADVGPQWVNVSVTDDWYL